MFKYSRVLSLLLTFLCAVRAQAQEWTQISDDLSMLQRDALTAGIFTPQISYFRTSLQDFDVQVIRARDFGWARASVMNLCRASNASLCINANFFDENGDPLGLVIHRGILVQPLHRGGSALTGIFTSGRNFVGIFGRSGFQNTAAIEAVQAGPRLLIAGKPVSGLSSSPRTRRTGLCIDSNKQLVLFITSSSFGGLSFEELQQELSRPDIACQDALNLDGGGSSQLFLSSKFLTAAGSAEDLYVAGRDEVPIALGLFRKSELHNGPTPIKR